MSVKDYSMSETYDIPLNSKLINSSPHILLVQTRIELNHQSVISVTSSINSKNFSLGQIFEVNIFNFGQYHNFIFSVKTFFDLDFNSEE